MMALWMACRPSRLRYLDNCWITMKCCTDIQDPQRRNPTDFCDHLTFPLAPPWVHENMVHSSTQTLGAYRDPFNASWRCAGACWKPLSPYVHMFDSPPLKTTTADQFDEALAEQVHMHRQVYDALLPLHSDTHPIVCFLFFLPSVRQVHVCCAVYILMLAWQVVAHQDSTGVCSLQGENVCSTLGS